MHWEGVFSVMRETCRMAFSVDREVNDQTGNHEIETNLHLKIGGLKKQLLLMKSTP